MGAVACASRHRVLLEALLDAACTERFMGE